MRIPRSQQQHRSLRAPRSVICCAFLPVGAPRDARLLRTSAWMSVEVCAVLFPPPAPPPAPPRPRAEESRAAPRLPAEPPGDPGPVAGPGRERGAPSARRGALRGRWSRVQGWVGGGVAEPLPR